MKIKEDTPDTTEEIPDNGTPINIDEAGPTFTTVSSSSLSSLSTLTAMSPVETPSSKTTSLSLSSLSLKSSPFSSSSSAAASSSSFPMSSLSSSSSYLPVPTSSMEREENESSISSTVLLSSSSSYSTLKSPTSSMSSSSTLLPLSPSSLVSSPSSLVSSPSFLVSSPSSLVSSSSLMSSSSSVSSSSFLSLFPKFFSPQKPLMSSHLSTTSHSASKCLFGPKDPRQNKDEFNFMRFVARKFEISGPNLAHNRGNATNLSNGANDRLTAVDEGSERHLLKRALTPVEASLNGENSTTKRRKTEGQLEMYYQEKNKPTIYSLKDFKEEEETVWRSPEKFGHSIGAVRLIPKTTPLRRLFHEESNGPATESGLTTNSNDNGQPPVKLQCFGTPGKRADESLLHGVPGSDSTNEAVPVARKVPVVQLKPLPSFRQRQGSLSQPNFSNQQLEEDKNGCCDGSRRRNSFSTKEKIGEVEQLCTSLEKISTSDYNNNNNNNNDNDKNDVNDDILSTESQDSDKSLNQNQNDFVKTLRSPSKVDSTSPQEEEGDNSSEIKLITSTVDDGNEAVVTSTTRRNNTENPYLKFIKDRESIGFVPINRLDPKDEHFQYIDEK